MELVSLNLKKNISRRMNWFGELSALLVIVGGFWAGMGGLLRVEYKGAGGTGEKQEDTALQQKVTHLLQTYDTKKSLDTIIALADKGTDMGLDIARAHERQKGLNAAFNAEAQVTGIALADARLLSPDERYKLYQRLDVISPHPDYFRSTKSGDNDAFILFNHSQSKVMDRPGFKPSVEAARRIVDYNGHPTLFVMGFFFGSPLLALGGVFAFSKARNRFNQSIYDEERAIRDAEEKERQAREAKDKEAAARAEAEARQLAEEQERLAKLPPSTTLDRDIQVRQIKLAPKV